MALWLHIPLAAHSNSNTTQFQAQASHSRASTTAVNGQQQATPSAHSDDPDTHLQQPNTNTTPDRHRDTYLGDPWQWWNRLRCLCGHSSKLGLILDIPSSLPPQHCIDRWKGEPVRAVMLSTKVFQPNRRGFPALLRGHQALVAAFYQLNVQVGLTLTLR